MEKERIPQAIWEGELKIGGITLRCYVLDDHTQIFHADDITALFNAGTWAPSEQEVIELAKWTKGVAV